MDARLSTQNNETNESNMDVHNANTMVSSLRALKLSAVEKFIDNYKQNGSVLFSSFEIYNNTHEVTENLIGILQLLPKKAWMFPSQSICMV